ncbi:hypothetical protein [Nostoc sp. NMS4]|uniref:hypothetical protein n=1 Tax=Nostoc sp. NMS4 TaxID=2815390 RepID=UPI0025F7270F|nr:hypothetical protein [Nostoc sp. NMS4]MBN3924629.1 hypothetical protein [Nostoc sp. NMS4]
MTKFYNNVKSRLNKKGINGFTKADYLEVAEQLGIVDLDAVNTDQIIAGVELLESKRSSQLVNAIAPTTEQLATQYQEAETLTQQKTEEEGVSAIAPLGEDTNESAITHLDEKNNSSELTLSNADELIQIAIENAPSDIKQNLLIQYAEREFQSASELIAFKHQIDSQIDEFLANELHQTATDRNAKWEKLQQKITTNADKNLAERKQAQSTFLSNLQARIAEFSVSKQEN